MTSRLLPGRNPAHLGAQGGSHNANMGRSAVLTMLQIGAGEGIRTLDPDLGKVVLYP